MQYCRMRCARGERIMHSMEKRAQIKIWLRQVLADKGWSAEHWANKAGIAATTITRFLSKDDDAPLLSSRTISKLEDASNISLLDYAIGTPPESQLQEDLFVRAVEEVLTYIKEEKLDLDPAEAAAGILELYRQYEERERLRHRSPSITLAGNVIEFPTERVKKGG